MSEIHCEQLPNGLVLLAEPVAAVQSLSMAMLVPAGLAGEPQGQQGIASILTEMICRGAGGLSAREHTEALDRLGIQRSTSAEIHHLRLGATMIASKLSQALPLLLDMIRRPTLEEKALEPSRDLALQALDSLEDEPQQRAVLELRKRHFPPPLGRSPLGERQDLEQLTIEQVRAFWRQTCVPAGSVIAFAGQFDWPTLRGQVYELLGDWAGRSERPQPTAPAPRGYQHVTADTAQVHLALAYEAPSEPDPRSILQRAATAVLSGGMSGRLFTEVREKRGLCYAVHANYAAMKDRGAVFSYAGTTIPRAQETLEVLLGELRRLAQGIEQDEFDRAIVGMKSRLVMQGESTAARAAAIATDQYMLGHPRTLDELATLVDAVTLANLNAYVRENPPGEMTAVTIGPDALRMPVEASC